MADLLASVFVRSRRVKMIMSLLFLESERAREKFVVGIKQKIEKKKNSFLSLSLLFFSGPLDVEILSSPSLGRRPVK